MKCLYGLSNCLLKRKLKSWEVVFLGEKIWSYIVRKGEIKWKVLFKIRKWLLNTDFIFYKNFVIVFCYVVFVSCSLSVIGL